MMFPGKKGLVLCGNNKSRCVERRAHELESCRHRRVFSPKNDKQRRTGVMATVGRKYANPTLWDSCLLKFPWVF